MTHTEDITKRVPPPRARKPAGSDCYSLAVKKALRAANQAQQTYWDLVTASDEVRDRAYNEYLNALEQLHKQLNDEVTL